MTEEQPSLDAMQREVDEALIELKYARSMASQPRRIRGMVNAQRRLADLRDVARFTGMEDEFDRYLDDQGERSADIG